MRDRLPRKLVAIVCADVAGYSRLTGEDEDATHRRLAEYLDIFAETVVRHGGRVLHYAGDAVLAEFVAVGDALICAGHIQRDLETRNRGLPEPQKVQFRVGINLGDVIEDRGDIYGDDVNIAARLESLAEPGGICVSESVHTAIGGKLPLDFEYMGEQQVKNISQPIRVYRARLRPDAELPVPTAVHSNAFWRWSIPAVILVVIVVFAMAAWLKPWQPDLELAAIERMAFPLPDKPSIAVLAFNNLSKDPDAGYLSDGISENIIAVLSKVPELFVIARNSSFIYKGKAVPARQVAEDFGVQYVLAGSLQQEGERIRVTAELIDALRGNQLWAETYDRTLEGIFAVQDDLALNIVQALQVQLTTGEGQFLLKSSTHNLPAWEAYTKGLSLWRRYNKEDNYKARVLMEEAIEHDPNWATAYSGLGWTHVMDAAYGWSDDWEGSLRIAEKFARKALAIDQTTGNAYGLLARIHSSRGQYEEAVSANERAIEVDPNNPSVLITLAFTKLFTGDPVEAIILSKRAERIQPITPPAWLNPQTIGYYLTARYEDAISVARRSLRREPEQRIQARLYAIASYSALGRPENARADVDFVLENDKDFSARNWVETVVRRHKDKSFKETLLRRLLEAGLPE